MKKITLFLISFFICNFVYAEVEIRISDSNASAISIAILPFSNNVEIIKIAKVVSDDLNLSGQFRSLAKEQLIENPKAASDIKYSTWQLLKADYLTIGSINETGEGRYEISMKLFSVLDKKQLISLTLPILEGELRSGGHYIADKIYEEITGVKGIFSTKIAYVTATRLQSDTEFQLVVADADGKNAQALVTSKQPLLSPSWSPRGDKLAYVSFERGNSAIFIQDLSTGQREMVSSYKGINSGPSFSPDGKKLALTLSKSGNPEIYIMDIYTKELKQITNSWAIDTNASWSSDSKNLIFTSDRGGNPNLYKVNIHDLKTKRITFEGKWNAGGSYSPNGEYICFVHKQNKKDKISILHNKSGTSQIISNGPLDETPTFAPNNNMILYATKNTKGQGILVLTSLDGNSRTELVVSNGNIREPSWSPVIN